MPISRYKRARKYPWGYIRTSILRAIGGQTMSTAEVVARTADIADYIVARNLSTLCIQGYLENVGTRQEARYRKAR